MSTEEETTFFHTLSDQLNRLTNSISTNGVVTIIDSFEGDPKAFREWTRSIEKYAVLASIPNDRMKLIAYQTSKGVVSNFIRRYLDTHPAADWPTLIDELSARFAEVTDAQYAFALLRKVKQNHNENVQCFGERLLVLASEAYSGTSSLEIEKQLVGFFVDGLKENYLKLKILRENPKTLQLAVTLAMKRMRCIWLLLLPVYGITAATKVSQNVLFRPVHQVSTSRSKWRLTLVHDITPFMKFTSDLATDIGRTLLTVDEIMTNYSTGNNSLEYENTFSKLKIEVITLRDEIEDLLDGVQDYRALSMKHARPRRALIPFVGKALSWLFGTVSTDDLNVIRSNIDKLANNQQAIQHVVAESLSILNVSRLHISENRQQVNLLSDSLRNLDIKIKNVVRQFKKKLVSLEGFLHLYLRMKLVLDDLKNMYLRAEMYASEIKLQLNMLSLGHLSPSVLTPGSLRRLLIEIQSHLPPSVRLPSNPKKNLWHYYRILNCVTIIENNEIIVVLNIPLLDSDRVFEIYKIHHLPLPMTNKLILSKSKATFKMVASYRLEAEVIAVNTDRTKYAILDSDEFTKCSDPLAGFCQITSPIYPINLSQLCIVALFTENREKIRQLCKVFIKPNCILPVATYLANGRMTLDYLLKLAQARNAAKAQESTM
ncbi:hypothetical protein LOTGIDRAFT_160045 [Lottia gigantea]|uniref:Retrotransposon gag domain-containing protein n=1 Tax=Lottia gigantea TaxID=225164 RepID=V4AGP5_LOTGI|nr:hypothetical protein LOTGIDRAFT_160045 [Lottia gigantea]ESO96062.1 hypothetical protein LOTGIDRAFT_160045 [Lottia gigantea]